MRGSSIKCAGGIGIILGGMLLLAQDASANQSVSFAWMPNSEPDVAGYKVYYGVASRSYSNAVDAGNATTATVSNLATGTTYYFALVAYNTLGVQSAYTSELVYSVPGAAPARLQMRMTPTGQTILTITGTAGQTYNVEASADFQSWATIRTVTLDASGSATVTEDNPTSRTRRFYRASGI